MLRLSGWIIGALLAILVTAPRAAGAETANVTILYTADTHGRLRSFYYDSAKPIGGVAKRAIFFQEKRRHKSMIWLTLDAGDALSGTALADVFQGAPCIQAMNMLKYDAMALGVHDFDFGIDVLKQRVAEADFPVLSANVKYTDTGSPFVTPYVILERDGVRIALLGLTTGELGERVAPGNFNGLQVEDPIETARMLVPQLAGQADVIVALTHLGINEDIRLASQVQGIDVIVGGMSHSELQVPMKFENTLIVHDADYGRNVGLLKLSFDPQQNYRQVYFANELEPMASKWVENSDYLAWLDSYSEPLRQRMDVIVGSSALEMSSTKVRSAEVPLGNYVTDILRDGVNADVAILPAEFFPAPLPEGPITLGDLYRAFPYDQYAVVLEITGGELKEVLDEAANQIGKPGFPQVSGVSFGVLGGQAYSVLVNGKELDLFDNYRLATTDVMAEGNYGYARLGTIARIHHTGLLIRDLVRQRLESGQIAQASVYQRIQFHAYDATLYAANTPEQNTAIISPEDETRPVEQPPTEAPAETPPPVYTPPPVVEEQPQVQPAETEITQPPMDNGAAGSPPEAAEDTTTADGVPDEQGEGLDSLRYDRNGQPLNQPVVVEDIALEDNGSAVERQPGQETEAPPPAGSTEFPPAADNSLPATPPSTAVPEYGTPPGEEQRPLGVARSSSGGLGYLFTLVNTPDGEYEFRLQIANTEAQPLELNYTTGSKYDFIVRSGTDLLWSFNWNRFFTQSAETLTLDPGETLTFSGHWDGKAKDGSQPPAGSLRFEAVHELADEPVYLQFDAVLPR